MRLAYCESSPLLELVVYLDPPGMEDEAESPPPKKYILTAQQAQHNGRLSPRKVSKNSSILSSPPLPEIGI